MANVSTARKASYALLALALWAAVRFHLGTALLAALFAHMILDRADAALRGSGAPPFVARWGAVALFAVVGSLLAFVFASFFRIGLARLPALLDRVLPRLSELASNLGLDVALSSPQDLRALILQSAKDNVRAITATSGLLTRGFFQIVVAVFVVLLRYLTVPPPRAARGAEGDLLRECGARVALFSASFERVMGAQVAIAAINALATAAFLFAVGLPFRTALILTTFVCGLVPIVGNVISNALIVAAALVVSNRMAVFALAFLVLIHKAEYFLNSRLVGARIELPMWATLAALLVGEATMGVTGVILAPTLLYYVREELRSLPAA
ncbi:MAG: AI-2E family transporter [Elusimicrobia bacterium]|nr:AI-2E family transporter [Elusimicrobiota bacterium]